MIDMLFFNEQHDDDENGFSKIKLKRLSNNTDVKSNLFHHQGSLTRLKSISVDQEEKILFAFAQQQQHTNQLERYVQNFAERQKEDDNDDDVVVQTAVKTLSEERENSPDASSSSQTEEQKSQVDFEEEKE